MKGPSESSESVTIQQQHVKRALDTTVCPSQHHDVPSGQEVCFVSDTRDSNRALPGRNAEARLRDIFWDLDQGMYLMSNNTMASNHSWTVGKWGPFEQLQKWREYGRRGWLQPLDSTWQTDMAQMQIQLWMHTMVACQHHSKHSESLSKSCQRNCIRRPGGACLFQKPHFYNSIFIAGNQMQSLCMLFPPSLWILVLVKAWIC